MFAGRAIASARTLAQALVGIGGLTLVLVLYHAYAGGIGKKPSVVLLILAVIATIPSVVALVLLKKTLWQARGGIRWTAPLLFAGGAIVLFAIGLLSALALAIFGEQPRLARDRVRRRARALPDLGHGAARAARRARLLVAQGLRPAARRRGSRRGRRGCSSSASTARSSSSSCSATRASRKARRASREHGSISAYNMISTIGAVVTARRRAGLPARGRPGAQRQARGQRPVARRHARVVHDLAAAAAQLRLRARRSRARGRSPTCAAR